MPSPSFAIPTQFLADDALGFDLCELQTHFHHQVVMIGHEAKSMDLPAGFLASLAQRLQKIMPVDIAQIDGLPTVAPAHDVVHGTRILDACLPWHSVTLTTTPGGRQAKESK
jgi:hypothetical protein